MKPALILAGGLGTRLRSVVRDLPKPLAEVSGRPFLWWLLHYLERQGVEQVFLSVGYRHEMIQQCFGERFGAMQLHYVVEGEALGTGGAVLAASAQIPGPEFLVFNGDTLAVVDLAAMLAMAQSAAADITLAVAAVEDAGRYGTVHVQNQRVQAFLEKGHSGPGLINAGVYHLHKKVLEKWTLPPRFSFEQDFLGPRLGDMHVAAYPCVSDFIDIGIPEDYHRAQTKVPALVGKA